MKRKVIKLGTATNVISLPAKWVAEHNIKAGDEIDLEESPGKLTIRAEKLKKLNSVKIDLRKVERKLIERYLYSAYTRGYDEIELLYNPKVSDRENKPISTSELIQKYVNLLIGIEIIEQTETRCLIKDISGTYEEELDPVLRRIFLLLKSFGEDCLNAIKENNSETLAAITSRHDVIFKFIAFYQRMLNRKGYKEVEKTSIMYSLVYKLETISDIYTIIAREASKCNCKYSEKAVKIFYMANKSFNDFYELFYTFSNESAVKIPEGRKVLWDEINEHSKKCSKEDIKIMDRLAVIVVTILDLVEDRFALEI